MLMFVYNLLFGCFKFLFVCFDLYCYWEIYVIEGPESHIFVYPFLFVCFICIVLCEICVIEGPKSHRFICIDESVWFGVTSKFVWYKILNYTNLDGQKKPCDFWGQITRVTGTFKNIWSNRKRKSKLDSNGLSNVGRVLPPLEIDWIPLNGRFKWWLWQPSRLCFHFFIFDANNMNTYNI
jgi:hypothetical protein